jgi:hypothetical protein
MAVSCVVHCQVSVTGWSLIQRSSIEYGVSECDLKTLEWWDLGSLGLFSHANTNQPPTWKSTRISTKAGYWTMECCTILTWCWKHNYMIWLNKILNKQIKSFIRWLTQIKKCQLPLIYNTPGVIWADAKWWMAYKNRTFKDGCQTTVPIITITKSQTSQNWAILQFQQFSWYFFCSIATSIQNKCIFAPWPSYWILSYNS